MILTIYNGKSNIVVFWHNLNSPELRKHINEQLINKHENKKCGNYYRHNILPKTVTLLNMITKTARFNYFRSSRRQVP